MLVLKILIGAILCYWTSGYEYSGIYNYNGHSYYMSQNSEEIYYIGGNCEHDKYYAVEITDEKENNVIESVIRYDRGIGIYYSYGKYYYLHNGTEIIYNNFENGNSGGYFKSNVVMKESSGKWESVYFWDNYYYICEKNQVSSSGQNVSADKILNIKYDDLITFRGHSYYIYSVYRGYGKSKQICKTDHDGYIFIPNDGLENCAINTKNHGYVYVGITYSDEKFISNKGYEASYLPWEPKNPTKQNCVVRSHITGNFKSNNCEDKKHIICETDSIIEGATKIECNNSRKHNYFYQMLHYNGFSITIFDFKTNREDAILLCSRRNAILFTPTQQQENCAIMESSDFTIGLNYGNMNIKNGLFRGDGYKNNYTNWASGYPVSADGKGCVYAYFNDGKWRNDLCYNTTFACREVAKGMPDTAICTTNYYQLPKHSYTIRIYTKFYSMFGRRMGYHDSVRLCSYYGLEMIKDTSSNILNKISDNIINTNFHINYRILWNDKNLTWLDSKPKDTLNWAKGEPKNTDFLISCISVTPNKTFVTNSCHEKYIPVCYGDNQPTKSTTTKSTTTSSSTSSSSTSNNQSTMSTTTEASTTVPTSNSTEASNLLSQSSVAASKQSRSTSVGVGIAVSILVISGIVGGLYYYRRKNGNLNFNIPTWLKSLKRSRSVRLEED